MNKQSLFTPKSWLAFEMNVLRRQQFRSIAIPFTGNPTLGRHLKHGDIRVLANDTLQSAWTRSLASIQNNNENLTDEDVNIVLEDVYIPANKLKNASLRKWFSETDSWWFDNTRSNLDRLQSPFAFAIAASLILAVGDYVLSFNEDTRELRQPLSNVFRRLWTTLPEPYNNRQNNGCQNKQPDDFIAETAADLMFLRLPSAGNGGPTSIIDKGVWREEWLRGGDEFWPDFEAARHGRLGGPAETKSQYLKVLSEALAKATHIGTWAVAHVEGGLVSTQEIVNTIGGIRRVEAVFTKDFSELTGNRAVIITA
ncbi:MAG TPA: hypothetical protein PKD26_00415 [Pyrinomonadaceae bacterium]|nr:hypothetical protein [Pyrinomonadaceae bacterium]